MEACFLFFTTFSFFLISSFPLSLSQSDKEYRECQPSLCGRVGKIDYPFWSDEIWRPLSCRRPGFQLHCPQDGDNYPTIQIDSQTFNVTEIDPDAYKMRLVRTDFVYDNCSSRLTNTSVSTRLNLFHYEEPYVNVTLLYECPQDSSTVGIKFPCQHWTSSNPNSNNYAFYPEHLKSEPRLLDLIKNCKHHVQLPVSIDPDVYAPNNSQSLQDALSKGFRVQYGFNESPGAGHYLKPKLIIEIDYRHDHFYPMIHLLYVIGVSGAIGLLLLCVTICCFKTKPWRQNMGLCKTSEAEQNIEAFITNHGTLALTRYTFADIKKMTDSFKRKLGKGGYGSVYKGKLLNGRFVAVKLLKASKENGDEFINEVASISGTSHVNVVTLLGFCFEGKKKALIYEFMSNGSLDKFIRNNINKRSRRLTQQNLYQISIGIARGLEYLHRGCNTRILHFDIKPHNILLDENFCPKISDFGLAKLCLKNESIISISEARGTIGYLAPEVWNRNIGGVSYKSDVYSYGMMLLEMVGGRNNMNVATSCSTDKYFPDYIYAQLEQDSSLGCNGAKNMEENDIAKRMTIVGLWCIQTFPSQRPTMSRVIEMLERRLDVLEMPPKPVLSSPPRLDLESSTTTEILGFESSSHMPLE